MITESYTFCQNQSINTFQGEVHFFPNPAGQKSRVKDFTYKSLRAVTFKNRRLRIESERNDKAQHV
jgi:hypothetical protein